VGEKMEKKIKLYILLAFLGVILLLGVSLAKDSKYSPRGGLTYAQKKKDAEYLIHLLKEVYPFHEKERKDGILPSDRKLISQISKTNTDEEFYKVVSDTVSNLKYGMGNITIMTFKGEETVLLDDKWGINEKNFVEKSGEGYKKWSPLMEKSYQEREIFSEIQAQYFEGDYYVVATQNPNILPGDKVIKIGGVPIEDYIKKNYEKKFGYRYYKYYDSKRDKEIIGGDLIKLENKDSKIEVTLSREGNVVKEAQVGVADPSKDWPVIGNNSTGEDQYENNRKGFLNILGNGKVVIINFSMEGLEDFQAIKKDVFKAIDNSEYLILDTRTYSNQRQSFEEIFSYVNNKEVKLSRVNIMRKNKYNDQVIAGMERQNPTVFKEMEVHNANIDKLYSPSKFHRLKSTEISIKGLGNYKGKVVLFCDSRSYFSSDSIVDIVKNNNNIISICDNNLETIDGKYIAAFAQAILPKSNLIVMLQNSIVVDGEGKPIVEEYIKPSYIVDLDKNLYEEKLRGEISWFYYDNNRRYTEKDEYYKKFLEIIKQE
jgi:hypothetical protein